MLEGGFGFSWRGLYLDSMSEERPTNGSTSTGWSSYRSFWVVISDQLFFLATIPIIRLWFKIRYVLFLHKEVLIGIVGQDSKESNNLRVISLFFTYLFRLLGFLSESSMTCNRLILHIKLISSRITKNMSSDLGTTTQNMFHRGNVMHANTFIRNMQGMVRKWQVLNELSNLELGCRPSPLLSNIMHYIILKHRCERCCCVLLLMVQKSR